MSSSSSEEITKLSAHFRSRQFGAKQVYFTEEKRANGSNIWSHEARNKTLPYYYAAKLEVIADDECQMDWLIKTGMTDRFQKPEKIDVNYIIFD